MRWLRRLWLLVSLAGTSLTVVGIVGLVADWGSTTHAAANAPATPVPTLSPPTTPSVGTRTSTSTGLSHSPSTTPGESPAAFFMLFAAAVRNGDGAFLASRLDAAVLARYDLAQCRSAVRLLHDPRARLRLVGTSGPIDYTYASDGRSEVVPDTFVFHVVGPAGGQSGPRDYHFALANGTFHLFIDCGTPRRSG